MWQLWKKSPEFCALRSLTNVALAQHLLHLSKPANLACRFVAIFSWDCETCTCLTVLSCCWCLAGSLSGATMHLVSSCELLQGQCGVDFMIAVNLSVVFNVGCGFTTVLWQVSIQGVLLRSFQAVSTHALR
jgi:hypothetical protein